MKTIKLSTILLLVTLFSYAQSPVTIKLNLEKNKSYHFKNTVLSNVSTTVNGMTQIVETTSSSYYSIKAIDSKPDFMIIDFRTDSSSITTNSNGKKTVFNSNIPGNIKSTDINDVMNCILNRMAKNALYLKVDYFGKIQEIVNLKMYSSIILKDIDSLNLQSSVNEMMKKSIIGMVDEKTLKVSFINLVNYIPVKPVSIGNSWENSYLMSNNGCEFNVNNSYKLESLTATQAAISNEANIKPASTESIEMYGFKMNFSDISGNSKANQNINTTSGLIINSSSKVRMSGNLAIEVSGNTINAPMEINTESTVNEL